MTCFDLGPQGFRHDTQFGHVRGDPLGLWPPNVSALACVRVLAAFAAVPDIFPIIERVIEDAVAHLVIAVDGGLQPLAATGRRNACIVQVLGDGAGRPALREQLENLDDKEHDPAPRYKADIESEDKLARLDQEELIEKAEFASQGGDTFAYEKDLQNYLARNLHHLESGLKLYEDEGLTGIEYNAGGRFIDILAVDTHGTLVVVELKVSRGYDRVIGQLLRYLGWVEANLGDGKPVRGMIVASEITEDLVLATSHIADRVKLFEYAISFSIKQKDRGCTTM